MAIIRIHRLVDHPAAVPTIAAWIDAEWGAFSGRTPAQTLARFSEDAAPRLPRSYVALDGAMPQGVASLRASDSVDWDPGVTPWLCNVYVPPEARGAGIAARLCRHVAAEAAALGFGTLSLASTAGDDSLYYRLGYRSYARLSHGGDVMHLMRLDLNP